jgi:hypothetical protein
METEPCRATVAPTTQTPTLQVLTAAPADKPAAAEPLDQLLNPQPQPSLSLQPATPSAPPTVIDAQPVSPPVQRRKLRRTGRIASLPKIWRDMVSRMIWNGVPYKNIVLALDEGGLSATERNVSNWATGGYLEWRLEQEAVLQNRLDQDHLVEHLRRDDASELPEVGLQAAATRLSQILLQKTTQAHELETDLDNFSKMVDVLCRLNKEIAVLQKSRDDSRRSLGRAHDPARIKDCDELSVNEHERFYSNPPPDSELQKPENPPILPPEPTSVFLANCDREDEQSRQLEHQNQLIDTLLRFSGKKTAVPAQNPSPPGNLPEANGKPAGNPPVTRR